jgi:CRP-like cAMP-binding protein
MSKCQNCIVRKFNVFSFLNSDELKNLTNTKTSKSYKKGDILFEEGEHLNGVFCVRYGIAKLSKLSNNGRDQIVKFVSNGEVLGQRSVIAQEAANLTAVAVNDMTVCFIPKYYIIENLERNPKFSYEFLKDMAHDLKEADNVIVNMSQNPVKQRLAEVLLHLKESFGLDDDGYLLIKLSREDISNIVGTATESCIRLLSELKKEGYITTSGKRIMIKDNSSLKQIARGILH